MPPTQLPLALAQRHNNRQLFSDHYLNVTLPQRPDWRLLAHDAGAALNTIAPIVRAFLRAPAQNEAQTEDDMIKPVLRALGHTFEIQAALKTPDGTKKPDYIFYHDQAALEANKSVKVLDEAALQSKALAIGAGQALLLKDQADPRDALLICILLDHGLRCGEVAALEVSAIDIAAGTLSFYRSKVHKTQTHRLTTDTLRAALAYLKQHTSGSLFGMTTREINRRVGQLGKAIGIERLSPHDCRHFWATAAVRGKTDIKSLQDAGGWTSPAMPLRYVESQAIANEGVRLG